MTDNSMQNFLYPDGSQRNPIAKKFIGTGERVQLHDLRTQDAGLYECVATNPINQLKTNHIFRLAVKGEKLSYILCAQMLN